MQVTPKYRELWHQRHETQSRPSVTVPAIRGYLQCYRQSRTVLRDSITLVLAVHRAGQRELMVGADPPATFCWDTTPN